LFFLHVQMRKKINQNNKECVALDLSLLGSITVPLTSCTTGLDSSVLQIISKIVSCHTADSKPVKQEVNSTVILPPLVFPDSSLASHSSPGPVL
jgi:hypothetical protein